jgi:hypothetical protein
MSASTAGPLRYVLPGTALTLQVTLRLAVVPDDQGGHLEPEVAAGISAPWHPVPLTSVRRVLGRPEDPLGGSPPASAVPGSLRRAFDRANPRTAALIADLSARSEQYLAGLRMGEESSQVVTFGQALEVVHRELAAADRTRREWISRQGRDVRTVEWDLTGHDLVAVPAGQATLPADTDLTDGRAAELAEEFGLLIGLTGESSSKSRARTGSATVVVYRRLPARWATEPADAEAPWVRDDALSRLRLIDAADAEVPQPRLSPEAGITTSAGRPPAGDPVIEAATRAARIQLDLLDASDEYSRLASTQYRAEEIAALQHQMRLAYMPRQRAGD